MFDTRLTAHLADLSKIAFTPEELDKMTDDMTDIIALMDKVKEFDANTPTYALDAEEYMKLRSDAAEKSFATEDIVKNAKNVKNNSFVVPKVV